MVHVGKSLFLNYFQLIPQVGLRVPLNPHGKSGRYYWLRAQAENRDAKAVADSPQVVSCKAEKATRSGRYCGSVTVRAVHTGDPI